MLERNWRSIKFNCGLFASGTGPAEVNLIEFVTIASMGNAFDFGDLNKFRPNAGGLASPTRALFGGGYVSPARRNTIDYDNCSKMVDFGDLTVARETSNECVITNSWSMGW